MIEIEYLDHTTDTIEIPEDVDGDFYQYDEKTGFLKIFGVNGNILVKADFVKSINNIDSDFKKVITVKYLRHLLSEIEDRQSFTNTWKMRNNTEEDNVNVYQRIDDMSLFIDELESAIKERNYNIKDKAL